MTTSALPVEGIIAILIHTSVKLVTGRQLSQGRTWANFNPHEREARDIVLILGESFQGILIHTSVKLVTMSAIKGSQSLGILIHTSVKLVT